jgi:subtilase family serine protease
MARPYACGDYWSPWESVQREASKTISNLSPRRIRRTILIVAAALAVTAGGLATGMASASTASPQHARTSAAVTSAAVAPSGLPSRQQQIRVLTAALANMQKNFKTLNQLTGGQFGPQDVSDYGVGDLWKQGIDGAGTTIAVLEGWDNPDIGQALAEFDKAFGLPAPPKVTTIFPAGPLPAACPPGMAGLGDYGSCNAWESETEGDVLIAHLIAPYAKIVISVTPATSQDDAASQIAMPEMMKALEVISSQHLANVASISNGTGEATYPNLAEILANNPGELTAAANGVPFTVATEDCGVVQPLPVANAPCGHVTAGPDTATWDDSPFALAVGGSQPHYSDTGQRLGPDTVWNATVPGMGHLAAGAGYSEVFQRPAYQDVVAHITGSPMRSVPDITADASGGTSGATPMIAGILALATQWNHGHDLGPVNPALYKIGPEGAAAGITDVTSGNDSVIGKHGQTVVQGFTAGPGFDVASGWGTVFAPKFVPSLVKATAKLGGEAAIKAQAAAQLNALEHHAITLASVPGHSTYLEAGGFLPGHTVSLCIDGKAITTLQANTLGDVTYMISPSLLRLSRGSHSVSLGSLLITETATFRS